MWVALSCGRGSRLSTKGKVSHAPALMALCFLTACDPLPHSPAATMPSVLQMSPSLLHDIASSGYFMRATSKVTDRMLLNDVWFLASPAEALPALVSTGPPPTRICHVCSCGTWCCSLRRHTWSISPVCWDLSGHLWPQILIRTRALGQAFSLCCHV